MTTVVCLSVIRTR